MATLLCRMNPNIKNRVVTHYALRACVSNVYNFQTVFPDCINVKISSGSGASIRVPPIVIAMQWSA